MKRAGIFRVVYRHELDGRSFKVQQNNPEGSYAWRTVDGFTTLHHATSVYPDAVADTGALLRQDELEQRPHGYQRDDNPAIDRCHGCGKPKAWAAHEKKGAAA